TTMQNVACPIAIVHSDKLTPPNAKNELSAIPVMIPGRAIGRTRMNETVSLPKNRNRWTAKAAAEPSTRATAVAMTPVFSDSTTALLTSGSWRATGNHFSDRLGIGQLWMLEGLNAYRMMIP